MTAESHSNGGRQGRAGFQSHDRDGSQVSLKIIVANGWCFTFTRKNFTSRLHDGGAQFSARLAKYKRRRSHSWGKRGHSQSHKIFARRKGLNLKLLADPAAKSRPNTISNGLQRSRLAARNTFIINPKGEVAKVYTGVKPAEHWSKS